MQHDTLTIDDAPLLRLLTDSLNRRLRDSRRASVKIDADTDLIELGLIDSQALLDMILEVEGSSGTMFDADGMDFERGVTLRRLAASFTPA